MTVPRLSTRALFDVAKSLGCDGVELRNDLKQALFDGADPSDIARTARQDGLTIFGLAEVKSFNRDPKSRLGDAKKVISDASACGAQGVALIPAVASAPVPRAEQRAALRLALAELQPHLLAAGLKGLVEPLGFAGSTLRHKEDVVSVLQELGDPECFAIIHDTFHHCLAGGGPVFARQTAMVHVSGVAAPSIAPIDMTDAHRGLVDAADRLDTIGQLRALTADGYRGPISIEAFAPEIHNLTDPASALAGSFAFMTEQLEAPAAGAA